jgi:hypothetical protein
MGNWIRIHWFEILALVLLGFNLWFVWEVLTVLQRVKDALLLLGELLTSGTGPKPIQVIEVSAVPACITS